MPNDIAPLARAMKQAWLPSLLVNERGEILQYSPFFDRMLRRQPPKLIIDLLPELSFVAFKKLWKDHFRDCHSFTPKMDLVFAPNQAYPSRLQFLPVSTACMLILADLPADGQATFHSPPVTESFRQTIIWEINLVHNRCILSGGTALSLLGLKDGCHKLTRLQLRRLIDQNLTATSRDHLYQEWQATSSDGNSFKLEVQFQNAPSCQAYEIHAQAAQSKLSTFCIFGHLEIKPRVAPVNAKAGPATPLPDFLLSETPDSISPFRFIKTNSKIYRNVLKQVEQVAPTDATVLITGETGTGKELLAQAVFENSTRTDKPFLKINCSALPENLIESQLFGHEKGAFTGAYQARQGLFARANGGTVFLDEIGELSLNAQAKLLRVLQEGTFTPVGGSKMERTNVRVIAATNRNLEQEVRQKHFRADLYFRVCVFPIHNLPLRERPEDLTILLAHFIDRYQRKYNLPALKKVDGASLQRLTEYTFPGNIRELENLVERAVILCVGDPLEIPSTAQT